MRRQDGRKSCPKIRIQSLAEDGPHAPRLCAESALVTSRTARSKKAAMEEAFVTA